MIRSNKQDIHSVIGKERAITINIMLMIQISLKTIVV